MSGLSEQQLAEIAAREAAATPGPWGVYDDGTGRLDIVAGLEETAYGYTGRREIAQTVESPMDNDPAHVGWGEDEDQEQVNADGAFIAHAREDVPALLAEAERLAGMVVTAYERVAELEQQLADAQVQAAAFEPLHLGDPRTLVSHRCGNPTHPTWLTAGRADRRGCPWCRLAELDRLQQPVGQTVFLADYDGAEDGPKLFATLNAAQAWVADWSTGDGTWDWFERDGIWEQWGTDPDSDRPAGRGAGIVTPLTLPGGGS